MKKLTTILALSLAVAASSFAQPNPDRNAYLGETHLHTSWSADAWLLGDRLTTPTDACN